MRNGGKEADLGPIERDELGIMRKLSAFVGQMRTSELYRKIRWDLLPPDTGNRILHALLMPVVRIQVMDDVPNRDAFVSLRAELREEWGVYAAFESARQSSQLRSEPTAPGDIRITVVMVNDPNIQELLRIETRCTAGNYSLHTVGRHEQVPEVILRIKEVIRKRLVSRYV